MPRLIKAAGGKTWSCFHGDLSADKINQAHALGINVLAWTVNEPALIARLIDLGVDGIVSDRPDLVRAEMQRHGLPVPQATPVLP